MFNEPWEEYKISDLFKITRGYVLSTNMISNIKTFKMRYPVYSSQTKENGLLGYYSDYLYENAITWTTDGANAGTVNYRKGKFYCTNVCGVLISDKVKADLMISEVLNKIAKNYVLKAGNPKLMNNVMADIKIKIPSNAKERNKISIFYTILNKEIDLYENKIILLNKYKRGLISLTFSNKNGCKEFKLKELLQPYTSKNTSLYEPVAVGKYGIRKRSEIYSKILSKDISKNKVIEKNTFVIGMGSKQIDFGILYEDVKYSVSPAYLTFKISKKINPKYLEEYLRNILPILSFKFMIIGARQGKNIDKEGFLNYSIYVPSIDRQNRISDTLIALDKKIEKENELLLLLKQYKQGLLQQMFI